MRQVVSTRCVFRPINSIVRRRSSSGQRQRFHRRRWAELLWQFLQSHESLSREGSSYLLISHRQLQRVYKNVLILRVRMPISDDLSPRNFITKISKYEKVVNIPNSMSVLYDLLPISIELTLHDCRVEGVNSMERRAFLTLQIRVWFRITRFWTCIRSTSIRRSPIRTSRWRNRRRCSRRDDRITSWIRPSWWRSAENWDWRFRLFRNRLYVCSKEWEWILAWKRIGMFVGKR